MGSSRVRSWEVSDAFWARVEPLIPSRERDPKRRYKRKPGGGRPSKPDRLVFEAILFVLRTGCQWSALPKDPFGSSSAVHARFLDWERRGFFADLWKAGIAEYDQMEGIAWRWQSIDGSMFKAPMARESVGPNPTDRGKKRPQSPLACGRSWSPAVDRRDRSKRQRHQQDRSSSLRRGRETELPAKAPEQASVR